MPESNATGRSTPVAPPELRAAITLYLPPDTDHEHIARLVGSMLALNRITAAIEVHPTCSIGMEWE